jgi:hypothetical protein
MLRWGVVSAPPGDMVRSVKKEFRQTMLRRNNFSTAAPRTRE